MLLSSAVLALAQQCAPSVAPHTMDTLVKAESSGNPYAIGVQGAKLVDQPTTKDEAVATAKSLIGQGAKIAAGLGQIYMDNWPALGLTVETVFDPCPNLKAAEAVLSACYTRATKAMGEGQTALAAALSCYNSNNFTYGYVKPTPEQPSYLMLIAKNSDAIKAVPEIQFSQSDIKEVDPGQKAQPVKPKNVHALEPIQSSNKKSEDEPKQEVPLVAKDQSATEWDVLGDFN